MCRPRGVPGDSSPPFSNVHVKILQFSALPKTLRNFLRKPECFLFGAGCAETSPGRGARQEARVPGSRLGRRRSPREASSWSLRPRSPPFLG